MKNSKGIWKKAFVLTLVGGLAFWLVNLDSLQEYFGRALSSDDLRYGPQGRWQAPF
jgi:hypothetical protein